MHSMHLLLFCASLSSFLFVSSSFLFVSAGVPPVCVAVVSGDIDMKSRAPSIVRVLAAWSTRIDDEDDLDTARSLS
jgi:hypothetical protein